MDSKVAGPAISTPSRAVVGQGGAGFAGGGQQLLAGHIAHQEVHRVGQLGRVVALGQLGDVGGDRLAMGGQRLAPLLIGGRGPGALEVIQRKFGVDEQAAAAGQGEHHVGASAAGQLASMRFSLSEPVSVSC